MRRRSKKGTGLIESIMAGMLLVPIALAMIDLSTMVIANSMNDTAAKNAARAAANQPDETTAKDAAEKALESFKSSPIVNSLDLNSILYQAPDSVTCETQIHVKLPVPFPGFANVTFNAKDVEPIVGQVNN